MGWGKIWDHTNDSNRHLTVLVTGFGSHVDVAHNPSGQCAIDLHDVEIDVVQPWGTVTAKIVGEGHVPVALQEPTQTGLMSGGLAGTSFLASVAAKAKNQAAPAYVRNAIENHHPDIVICLGVASELGFRIERYAHNEIRPGIPENTHPKGFLPPRGTPTIREVDDRAHPFFAYLHDGTTRITLEATLPIDDIKNAIERRGSRCTISEDPGKYVDDDGMMEVLSEIQTPRDGVRLIRGGFIHVPGIQSVSQAQINKCVHSAIEATVQSVKPYEYKAITGEDRAEWHASLYVH